VADIVVVGSLNMDIVAVAERLPRAGETILGTHFLKAAGGKGANQAYAAAVLGGSVAMVGCVGDDEHGRQLVAGLAAAGCDVSGVKSVDAVTGVAVILVSESGENSIVVVPGANARFDADRLEDAEHAMRDARFALLQLEIPLPTVIAAARMAKRRGATVILDPAPAPLDLAPELVRHVDILTPNESEALRLTGDKAAGLSLDEARALASRLLARGIEAVVLKLGARGCLVARKDERTFISAPRVDAIDTTAAGDVFNGALATANSEGASLVDACRFAVRAASLSVTRRGAQPSAPTRSELNTFSRD
jgi:ribokinase